ncbi:MAG: cobyric acid synthase [Clostridiales bacterium]|jgi:adenosylcobyric acid synthase|nr:cobyric acid synthase [Clostridiales bacterium]
MGAVIMVQGTSSDTGKSILCAALCRWLSEEGYTVAPFKAQNMALNAMVVPGGEIGWAQVMQAEAARVAPMVEMNPVLLKPVSDTDCQVIVSGKPVGDMSAAHYQEYKQEAFPAVLKALTKLRRQFDVVVIEGAGSPAEVNLRDHDIVNMRLAAAADAPVLLAADIDRGGVFAAVVGTLALLTDDERNRVQGVIINKFRGIKERLQPGLDQLTEITGKPIVGVVPFLEKLSLPAEDSLGLRGAGNGAGELQVVVITLPRIANFTDYHVLAEEEGVSLRFTDRPGEIGSPHLIILPGTKNTLADLAFLRDSGLAETILAAQQHGSYVVGVCGGYQMLGERITDPSGSDGTGGDGQGLGLLPVETEFYPEKTTIRVTGKTVFEGESLEGYEIHMGRTIRLAGEPFASLAAEDGVWRPDGAVSGDGRVIGTYLHGLFDSAQFRQGFLNRVRVAHGLPERTGDGVSARQRRESSYRLLAQAVRDHLDLELLHTLIQKT